jgi:hypothetical protein
MTADAGIMLSRTNLPQLLQVSLQAVADKKHCCAWLRMLCVAMACHERSTEGPSATSGLLYSYGKPCRYHPASLHTLAGHLRNLAEADRGTDKYHFC